MFHHLILQSHLKHNLIVVEGRLFHYNSIGFDLSLNFRLVADVRNTDDAASRLSMSALPIKRMQN